VLAPALAAWAWTATASENVARHEARTVADAVASAPLTDAASAPSASTLGDTPPWPLVLDDALAARVDPTQITVEWSDAQGNHHAGPAWPPHQDVDGFFDLDGDTRVDGYQRRTSWGRVIAPIVRRPAMDPVPLVLGILPAFAVVLAAILLLTRMLSRDLELATGHVRTIAQGVEPTPLRADSLATLEVRALVRRLDELVGRIADANVDTYVAIEKAHEAERLKGQFLANMSHDLRSPLNSILGFSELLLTGIEGEIHPEQRELLEIIQRSGRELLQQIDEILDTAKLEAGRMELHAEPTPPATLVSRAITQARRRRPEGVEWVTSMAAGLPSVFVDPFRVAQALEHVFVFAAERVEEGTIDVQIKPRTDDRLGRFVEIHVTTPRAPAGIDELDRMRFGFVRIPGHRGLGLGLPIAGSILELTGGGLAIEPASDRGGEGMRFVVQLPAPEVRRRLRLEIRPGTAT
jgi:signal transduction histidine kinase